MPQSRRARLPPRRTFLGPVVVTGVLMAVAVVTSIGSAVGEGWELPWLLLGLTAGYALSGSA